MKPPGPQPGPPSGGGWTTDLAGSAAIAAILGVGVASVLMWATAQLASIVSTGRVLNINIAGSGPALINLRHHLSDPAAA